MFILVITLLNEVMCYSLKQVGLKRTYIFYNIYYYVRFPLLGLIFQTVFAKRNKAAVYFTTGFFFVSFFLFFIFFQLYEGLNRQVHTSYLLIGGVFVIINCLLLFYQAMKEEELIGPFSFPFFLCSVALFLYFLGILPFFGILNILVIKYYSASGNPALIAKSLSIIIYSLISIDYYLQWKRMKSSY
ncbi:MAG: hypothetical protein H7258_15280 [Ferruginibacter sp.]|nr:hypothetical protein [Ferruginibacter sp.]